MKIKWKSVFIGVILTLILSLTFGIIFKTPGLFLSVIIVGLIIGYINNDSLINNIINGGIFGGIGGLILWILIFTGIGGIIGTSEAIITLNKSISIINSVIMWAGLGLMGSAIGSMITKKSPEMERRNKSTIELSIETIQKCACLKCPIQIESKCAQNKIKNMQEMMKVEKNIVPNPKNIPGMYCINGKAVCDDLDRNKECNCINCDLWKENNLESEQPNKYFCQNGKVKLN